MSYPPMQHQTGTEPITVQVSTSMLPLLANMIQGEGTYNVPLPSINSPKENYPEWLLGFVVRMGLIRSLYPDTTPTPVAIAWIFRFNERFGLGSVPYPAITGTAAQVALSRETTAATLRASQPGYVVSLPALVNQATIDLATTIAGNTERSLDEVYRTAVHMYLAAYSKDVDRFFVPVLPL